MLRGPGVPAGSSLPGCQAGRPVAIAAAEVCPCPSYPALLPESPVPLPDPATPLSARPRPRPRRPCPPAGAARAAPPCRGCGPRFCRPLPPALWRPRPGRPGRTWRPVRTASLGLLPACALACALPWTAPPGPPPGSAGQGPASAEPWLATPLLQRLHPPLPGALVEDARFLEGGELALTVRFPPDPGREAWVLELPAPETPGGGSLRRLGPPEGAPALAVAPAGDRVAYLARGAPPAGGAPRGAPGAALGAPLPDEVWVSTRPGDPGERIFTLPPDAAPERLADLSWSPDGRHLLVLSQRPLPTGARRARLLWLDAGPPTHLQALPGARPGPVRVPPAPGAGAGPQGVRTWPAPSPAAEATRRPRRHAAGSPCRPRRPRLPYASWRRSRRTSCRAATAGPLGGSGWPC